MADLWTITGQRQVDEIDSAGRIVPSMRIDYETIDGVTAYEVIPLSLYQPEFVREVLNARAQVAHDVHTL
jgi:hypothetical protein